MSWARVTLSLVVLLACFGTAGIGLPAEESVSIRTVLSNVDSYNLRQITLRGLVRRVQSVPPHQSAVGGPVLHACTFVLDDGTASIDVHVFIGCPVSELETAATKERTVEISALMHSNVESGKSGRTTYAEATAIQLLSPLP